MPSDYENGAKKTIDISIKAEKMTADVLKSALQEFLSGKAEKKGRMTYKQLQAKSPSKLDSIEVNDSNIGDFLNTARKYDIDFALKRDKSTSPPMSSRKTERNSVRVKNTALPYGAVRRILSRIWTAQIPITTSFLRKRNL